MSWSIVKVNRGTNPCECSREQINASKLHLSSKGYTYSKYDDYGNYEDFVVTSEDCFESAVKMAYNTCDMYSDSWLVNSETLEIVRAFRMSIERMG